MPINNIKTSVRYFPFCPGIPWQTKNTYDIIPKLNIDNWNRVLSDRNIILVNFGGLFESFLTLSYAEALNKLNYKNKIYFNGNIKFNNLINLNGLISIKNLINSQTALKYTLPIFLDKSNNVYFNCLNNYIDFYGYNGKFRYQSSKSLSEQLFSNSCLNWNINYIPQFRNLKLSNIFFELKKSRKFDIDKPFVLIFPDNNSGLSMHSVSTLGWSTAQIKSFVSMVQPKGIQTVIVTQNIGKYTGINSLILPFNFETILCLIEKSSVILSEEIDFLLMGLLLSVNGIIVSKNINKQFSIKKNQKYLQTNKKLFISKTLEPIEVYREIK